MSTRVLAAMQDAETKAWEALSGYKFWMFGYHAARWVNYNQLLEQRQRFRSPFRTLVVHAAKQVEGRQLELPLLADELERADGQVSLPLLGSEGDGA